MQVLGSTTLSGSETVVRIAALGDFFFAFLGQSNAKGIADYSGTLTSPSIPVFGAQDPAENYETPYSAVKLYSKTWVNPSLTGLIDTGWIDTQPYDVAGNANMGPELSAARLLNAYATTPVKIAKFAVGGSSLAFDWLDPAGDQLAVNAIAFLKARQAELGGMRLGGVFWDQCEADATDATMAANYSANMTTIVGMFRAVFGPITWVFKRLSSAGAQTYNATVRTQQALYAASDSNSVMIDSDDTKLYDGLHYDARSCQLMGDRYALAMIQKRYPITVPSTTFPYFVGADAQRVRYTSASPATVDVSWWGGTLPDDVGILVVVGTKRNQTPLALTTAAGFTLIGTFKSDNATDRVFVTLYWCRADATTMAANSGHMPTVTLANSNHNNYGKIYVFRNCVKTGLPYDDVSSLTNTAYGTSLSIPAGNTVQPNQLIALFSFGTTASSSANRPASIANGTLANLTVQKSANPDTGTTTVGEDYVVATLATGELATAGDYGATTGTYPQSTLSANFALSLLGLSSGSAPSLSGVTKDATSNWLRPANNTEVALLGAAVGITSWTALIIAQCQEASGNLADSSGNGLTLTALNTPQYANTDAGWTAKSVGMTDGSTMAFSNTTAGLADPATSSYLTLMAANVLSAPAAIRSLGRVGSTASATMEPKVTTTPATQFQTGATAIAGATNPTGAYKLWTTQSNVTTSTQRLMTGDEVVNNTFTALAGKEFRIGRTVVALAPAVHINHVLVFSGANAEIPKNKLRKVHKLMTGVEPGWI